MHASQTPSKEPYLRLIDITKTFGSLVALKGVTLDIAEGEFVCFLGPSGCGKTTLLRIIAGLEQQNTGRVIQAGKDISDLPVRERDFGIVFQSYALFPNMTAAKNIAYGLENMKLPRAEIKRRVQELLELVGLPDVGHKYPSQLSGGQQQRIALARALATNPGLLLLDEPLSALDAKVRAALRLEIKELQRRLGITTIFVTHDQEEALVMADRIVVMSNGVIEQVGTPTEIYISPATPFVADFVGVMNFFPGQAAEKPDQVVMAQTPLQCAKPHHLQPGREVIIAIRPEDVRLEISHRTATNTLSGTVREALFMGSFYRLLIRLQGIQERDLTAEVSSNRMRDLGLRPQSKVEVHIPPDLVRVYPNGRELPQ
jgi:iron(III) transport system ATP-binding protein